MSWDEELSPESPAYAIASSDAERLRVLAGPGTGKSFAMKRRVARLLEMGVEPAHILPVTFTKVAAEDLHRELVQMGAAGCEQLHATTLHSLALRGLMRAHVLVATGRQPRPLNDFERRPLEQDLAADFGGVRNVRKRIKAFEAAWAREQHEVPNANMDPQDAAFENSLLSWLRFHRAMLIGEVIPVFLEYLRNDPHAPERAEFSHILVDEFQDLNRAEQELIELMSGNANVCIVGDDDQSIYGFKHANPEGIRTWCEDIEPPREDASIGECRRCPARVVRMANRLIARNINRNAERQLTPRDANGEGIVRIIRYATVDNETQAVAQLVHQLVQEGVPPGHILVLAQRDVIGTPIYESLVELGVPAKSYYAEAELETEFVQERYAYLRLLTDTDDRVALRWLLGVYSANWNVAGYRRVRAECEQTGLSPWTVLSALVDGQLQISHTGNLRLRFEEVRVRIDALRALMEGGGIGAVVDELFPEDEPRVRDIRTLMLQTLAEQPDLDIRQFLGSVNDAITKPEIPELVEDVRIMSLHKSKGLSSSVTIIAGCVEGLLPRQPADELSAQEKLANIEEQRRLFYVGITRVKAIPPGEPGRLILTSAREMPAGPARRAGIRAPMQFGQAHLNASRFLSEFGGHAPAVELG
jgi:superfamily I DNA/RNA helicase